MNMLEFEVKHWESGYKYIAGIDETGRGPLAGPVVSAAVVLPKDVKLPEVKDSKKVSEKKRERLFDVIHDAAAAVGVGLVHEEEIDKIEQGIIKIAKYLNETKPFLKINQK